MNHQMRPTRIHPLLKRAARALNEVAVFEKKVAECMRYDQCGLFANTDIEHHENREPLEVI
jgi:hypothetical protein